MLKKIITSSLLILSTQNIMAISLDDISNTANKADAASGVMETMAEDAITEKAKEVATESAKEATTGAMEGAVTGSAVEGGMKGAVDGAKSGLMK